MIAKPHATSQPRRIRKTRQRDQLQRLMESLPRPMTAQEIYSQAMHDTPHLGIATVYRTLRMLEEQGVLRQILLPRDSPRFEPLTLPPHHYFHCKHCSRVYWVFGRMPYLEAMAPAGSQVERCEVYLYGNCPACAPSCGPEALPRSYSVGLRPLP